MNHLSLFSGIGGLDLAAEWAGFTTVAFVERDPYCQRVLARRWPGVPCYGDVREVVADPDDGRQQGRGLSIQRAHEGARRDHAHADGANQGVRLISGGFPCQPHSVAGKRKASADDRDLWPEFARVIREIRPRWVVAENVPGLLHSESGRFFGAILGDLADMGYSAGWGVWGAADVGALHRRERVFIVAHDSLDGRGAGWQGRLDPSGAGELESALQAMGDPTGARRTGSGRCVEGGPVRDDSRRPESTGRSEAMAEPEVAGLEGWPERRHAGPALAGPRESRWSIAGSWEFEPDVGRVAHGVPSRVDRLRALGNSVVPQQAYPLFAAIAEIERTVNIESEGKT